MATLRNAPSRMTTAEGLMAFREELRAGGLDSETVNELVLVAARIVISEEGLCLKSSGAAD